MGEMDRCMFLDWEAGNMGVFAMQWPRKFDGKCVN